MAVNRSRLIILACQTSPTSGVSGPRCQLANDYTAQSGPRSGTPSTHRGEGTSEGEFGVQVCLNHGLGRFLTRRDNHKGASLPEPQPNDAFLTLVGHCVDGYLISHLQLACIMHEGWRV